MAQTSPQVSHWQTPTTQVIGDQPGVLQRISDSNVNLALWRRSAIPAINTELATLSGCHIPDQRRPTARESFAADLSDYLQAHGLSCRRFSALRADMLKLASLFFQISDGARARFRLLTIDSDQCCRFHVDRMDLRLLCTYQGPGTQYLADEQANRSAQRRGAPNEAILRHGVPAQFETFWVGIMQGDPANLGEGLIHRSPPISGTGQRRVLFCLDNYLE